MNEKLQKTLEFDKILIMLEMKTETALGKSFLTRNEITSNIEVVKARQKETSEGVMIILSKGMPPLGGVYPVMPHIKRAKMGGILNPGMLLKIGDMLRGSRVMKQYLASKTDEKEDDSHAKILENLAEQINKNTALENLIFSAIISEEEIADSASKKLRQIRRDINLKHQQVRDKLNNMITSATYKKYLQESIVTMRNDRYVLPVKQEYRGQVKGLIHDQSASGATLFVEPLQIVEINNEISTLRIEEKREIERILAEFSAEVADFGDEIIQNEHIMGELDFIFAKAKLSLELSCNEPLLNKDMRINIKKGRHPLIPKGLVVPIDIWVGKDFKTLIITGPNTGGKTVSLKTIGLFVLMVQYGLHIPVASGTDIAVFSNIYADVGDEQSIEQSLSTFSSHMKNIVSIMDEIESDALVLLDEVGAGTDPIEGAALAMAILNKLGQYNIVTVATTHYSELKVYALTHPEVMNGSVEFDVETLSPTYKVSIGVPGKSNAFEISKKLGLNSEIIEQAKNLIEKHNVDFEDALRQIEKDRIEISEAKEEIVRLKSDQIQLKQKIRQEEEKLKAQKDRILRDAKYEARRILENTKKESTEIINKLENYSSLLDKNIRKDVNDYREQLNSAIKSMKNDGYTLEKFEGQENVAIWDYVFIPSLGQQGQVISEPSNDGKVMVQAGAMKISVPVNTLKKVNKTLDNIKHEKGSKKSKLDIKSVKGSIDLRGLSLEEAFLELDKYIDNAYLAGLNEVQIIHGKGTGILRQGVTEYLKGHKQVHSFRIGEYGEGGTGITIVKL